MSTGSGGQGMESWKDQRTPSDKRASWLKWIAMVAAVTAILVARNLEGSGEWCLSVGDVGVLVSWLRCEARHSSGIIPRQYSGVVRLGCVSGWTRRLQCAS
jgi:hypothetical protein